MLAQPVLHALAAHLRPASQTLPQLPQFWASVVISTHVPAQHSCSSLHGSAHAPSCGKPAEPPAPALSAPAAPLKPAKVASPPESALIPPLLKLPAPLTPPWSDVSW